MKVKHGKKLAGLNSFFAPGHGLYDQAIVSDISVGKEDGDYYWYGGYNEDNTIGYLKNCSVSLKGWRNHTEIITRGINGKKYIVLHIKTSFSAIEDNVDFMICME